MSVEVKNKSVIKDDVKSFLSKHIKGQELADDQNFFASGLLNSMFAMQLVMFVEKQYSIKIENQDLEIKNFSTLNAIADFVDTKLG